MMIDLHGLPGGVYARASEDKNVGSDLEGISVAGQEEEAEAAADALGVLIVDVYNDNKARASRGSKKRKNWERMLADIKSGRLKVLIMWELSRGSRGYSEWGLFLDLIEDQGVPIYCISHERTYNPRNHKDMEILQQEGAKAAAESRLISARTQRGARAARRRGRPLGVPPLGWTSVYNAKTGKMVTWEPVEREIRVVAELYRRVLAGEALVELARDLNRRAELPEDDPEWAPWTKRGKRWAAPGLKSVLGSPVHIGHFWAEEDGKRVLVKGQWGEAEGIDEATWWGVHNLLNAPERKRTRPSRQKYLLTTIAKCHCGSPLGAGKTSEDGRTGSIKCLRVREDYTPLPLVKREKGDPLPDPSQRHVGIKIEWIDPYVRDEVITRMCDDALVEALTSGLSEEQAAAQAEASKIRADIAAMKELALARAVEPRDYADYKAQWEPEARRLEEQASERLHAGAVIVRDLRRQAAEAGVEGAELREALLRTWEKLSIQGKRDTIRAMTDSITVYPGRRGAHAFDSSRVEII